jgi:hypothetical protein
MPLSIYGVLLCQKKCHLRPQNDPESSGPKKTVENCQDGKLCCEPVE